MTRFLCFATICLGLTSCLGNSESTCNTTLITPTLAVAGPKTIGVSQPAVFTLDYELTGACGTFLNVAEQPNGNTRYVGVNVQYSGCTCPATTIPKQAAYTFQSTQPGTYLLQFITTTGYITDTLVVH